MKCIRDRSHLCTLKVCSCTWCMVWHPPRAPALGHRDQVLHCSPWHDLLKWAWHPVTGQPKAALSSKSFDKACDSREGVFYQICSVFWWWCFSREQKDGSPLETALLNCLSLCKNATAASLPMSLIIRVTHGSAVLVPFGMGSALSWTAWISSL